MGNILLWNCFFSVLNEIDTVHKCCSDILLMKLDWLCHKLTKQVLINIQLLYITILHNYMFSNKKNDNKKYNFLD